MPGACCTRGLVCNKCEENAHEHTGTAGALRHSLRNGLTAYTALSLETNSFCLHRRRIEGLSKPGWVDVSSAGLTPATGARTTRLCRTQPRQSSTRCVRSRTRARPANTTTRPTLPRPPRPAPTFVTMANAPLPGRDGASCRGDLGWQRRSIFLPRRLDGANHVEVAMENRFLKKNRFSIAGSRCDLSLQNREKTRRSDSFERKAARIQKIFVFRCTAFASTRASQHV